MRTFFARLACGTALACAAAVGACGEDHADVRVRPDGGGVDAGDGGLTVLACGVVVPATYESAEFATNAKEELDLETALLGLDGRMKAAEGAGTSIVTTTELRALYEQGTPSLKSASTSAAQAVVDNYFVAFGDAVGKTWSPDLVDLDGGGDAGDGGDAGASAPLSGGKYNGTYYFSPTGIDLHQATVKTLYGGAFYNHALVLVSGPVTEATVDRLLASYGASTKFLASTDPDAGADADALIAEYASQRDDKSKAALGPYRRIRVALLSAKAAAGAGSKCADDLDASLKVFLAEWEKATYASAIYYLNDAANKAIQQKGDEALHAFGQAVGFLQSFRGVAQDRRKITDKQIDDILAQVGAPTAYQLVTQYSDRVKQLVDGINAIAVVYGWTADDVTGFEALY
jgi:hypothetical protein